MIALVALSSCALLGITVYACCVVAGEADRRMEEMERRKGEEDGNG